MRNHWKNIVMIAAMALCLGIAAPAWSQTPPLADPMAEDYSVHVIPFYKINQNWFSFLVVSDTSWQDLAQRNVPVAPGGTPIFMNFYDATCRLQSDAIVRLTRADSQVFALHDPTDAQGQFAALPGLAPEGVILLDSRPVGENPLRFLTYILLINTNNNSMIRIDSIPCQGPELTPGVHQPCTRATVTPFIGAGTWLRYDTFNTVAATFGDSAEGIFETWLYFFTALSDLRNDLQAYGTPRHGVTGTTPVGAWASGIHLDAWCDEIYLGSRRHTLKCTERVGLSVFNYSLLTDFPNDACAGRPGRLETYASEDGIASVARDYSGFQETIAELVPGVNMIGTGYMHHSEIGTGHGRPIPGVGQ